MYEPNGFHYGPYIATHDGLWIPSLPFPSHMEALKVGHRRTLAGTPDSRIRQVVKVRRNPLRVKAFSTS